jgi:type VI protein secretion system component Hcp
LIDCDGCDEEDAMRTTALLAAAVLAVTAFTGCMGDDDEGSAAEKRRSAALVPSDPRSGDGEARLIVAGVTTKDAILVESYGWGGGRREVGPVMNDFHFVKTADSTSPKLYEAMVTGQAIPSARLEVKPPGSDPAWIVVFELADVVVDSYQLSGHGATRPLENVTLKYGELTERIQEDAPGGDLGSPVVYGYDVKAGTKQ